MKTLAAALAATLGLVVAGPVLAGWSAPQRFAMTGYPEWSAVAVDSSGDAAVAWATAANRVGGKQQSVHLLVRLAGGRLLTRTLWSAKPVGVGGVTVAIGHREATVAWSWTPDSGGQTTVEAAYGPLSGPWAPPRAIGYETEPSAFVPWRQPALAESADGTVLLTWDTFSHDNGIAVAWRSPHHWFGAAQSLTGAPEGATPQFDGDGNAYLASNCYGTVLIARAHAHRFRSHVVTTSSVVGFRLSLSGSGRGLAAWVNGQCSFGGAAKTYGPVFASVLHGGAFSTPLALTSASAQDYPGNVVAMNGGGTVTWSSRAPAGTQPTLTSGFVGFVVQIGTDGRPGATQPLTSDPPFAADAGGDIVFTPFTPALLVRATAMFIRPARGGAPQTAPSPARPAEFNLSVASPIGRTVALTWTVSPGQRHWELSVWRP